MTIDELLAKACEAGASDLHLSAGHPPMLRVDGELRALDLPPLSDDALQALLDGMLDEARKSAYRDGAEQDFAMTRRHDTRFRVNVFRVNGGPAAVFRVVPAHVPDLLELAAPPIIGRLAEAENGLILMTGPTGSGKSTTLAAMVDHINATARRHILTIEDPIEFVHASKLSLVNQREVGRDTASFADALRSALREDPDVILVGELRDRETIALALTAAETGHLVLGTLHTASSARAVDRMIDAMPVGEKDMARAMLAGALRAVIAQVLLRARGGGRVAAFEVLVATPAVRNLIRENKIAQLASMIQMGTRFGMQTMADDVARHVQASRVDAAEGRRALLAAGFVEEG